MKFVDMKICAFTLFDTLIDDNIWKEKLYKTDQSTDFFLFNKIGYYLLCNIFGLYTD